MDKTTKTDRLLSYLKDGSSISANKMQSKFKIANPSATVSQLRRDGYCIYANKKKGSRKVTYRLGTPTRAMVASAAESGFFCN